MILTIYVSIIITSIASALQEKIHPLSDEFIEFINQNQNHWRAGRNFHKDACMDYLQIIAGGTEIDIKDLDLVEKYVHGYKALEVLPEHFDARWKWQHCPSLHEIRDQGACGSCWAEAVTEIMTDRYCIFSNQTKHFTYSVNDLVSCCARCGTQGEGCRSGKPKEAFEYLEGLGIVSGGEHNSGIGCRPYEIPPRNHTRYCSIHAQTPTCLTHCKNGMIEYNKDRRYAKPYYYIQGEEQIKAEIFHNGPVMAAFTVYSDFFGYKSSVYTHTAGQPMRGYHAVKLLGWGVEQGKKYWVAANSWNQFWGDDGYFKILRGANECGIESYVMAAIPVISDSL